MARPTKRLRHNILIVCEGENTEPQYFASLVPLAKKAWANTHQLFIDIKPKPTLEEEQPTATISKHKTPRKKRALKKVKVVPPTIIEAPYKAVPVRYVREAQQGLEDGIYEEVWAVFDKDEHPKHQEAFELAEQEIDGKKVQIAFSSISFEHWILLHFEKNKTAFLKSECKEKLHRHSKSILCGTGQHSEDCYGLTCACGYLKTNKLLPLYSKKASSKSFAALQSKIPQALENAAWLRHQVLKHHPNTPIYDLNPYTTIDKLVRHLLQIYEEVVWMSVDEIRNFGGLQVQFSQESATEIALKLTNQTKAAYLFLPVYVYLKKGDKRQNLVVSKTLVRVGESRIIRLNISDEKDFQVCFVFESYRILLCKD